MRTLSLATACLAAATGVTAIFSLSEYAGNIPSCADAAFKAALSKEGCSTTKVDASNFDCICLHVGGIAVDVQKGVASDCAADFANALGGFCGTWEVESTTATDYAAATSIIAADLAGSGGSPTTTAEAGSTTPTSTSTSTGTGAPAAASSATQKNAAAASAGSGIELLGAAAMVALVL